jgi:hypothetical protein
MAFTAQDRAELRLVYDNARPVDITDFGHSLTALGREYENFVVGRFEPPPVNARLYLAQIESGSIAVTLETLLDQASFIVKNIDVFAGFVANLQEVIDFLLQWGQAQERQNKQHLGREHCQHHRTSRQGRRLKSHHQCQCLKQRRARPCSTNHHHFRNGQRHPERSTPLSRGATASGQCVQGGSAAPTPNARRSQDQHG